MTTIYTDNHGREIAVGDGLLTASASNRAVFAIPLDADQLAELGTALIERSIAEKHGEVSERAGAAIGHDLLDELLTLRGRPQAEAFRAVRDKLHALGKLEHFNSAAGGFAVAIVNVLERGIANLPQCEEGA
ncbi:MAG: hypothetical protein PHW78_02290 [Macromonas bipunctata]|nr:hypothetical protein [Macromonas bipunctata]